MLHLCDAIMRPKCQLQRVVPQYFDRLIKLQHLHKLLVHQPNSRTFTPSAFQHLLSHLWQRLLRRSESIHLQTFLPKGYSCLLYFLEDREVLRCHTSVGVVWNVNQRLNAVFVNRGDHAGIPHFLLAQKAQVTFAH